MTLQGTKNDIVALILRSVKESGELGITKIMYKSYLSYRQVAQFLVFIKENELLEYDGSTMAYRITEKGLHYLDLYDKMNDLFRRQKTGIINSLVLVLLHTIYPLLLLLGDFI